MQQHNEGCYFINLAEGVTTRELWECSHPSGHTYWLHWGNRRGTMLLTAPQRGSLRCEWSVFSGVCLWVNSCFHSAACLSAVTVFQRSRIKQHRHSVCVCVERMWGRVLFQRCAQPPQSPINALPPSELVGCHGNGSSCSCCCCCCRQHPIISLSQR